MFGTDLPTKKAKEFIQQLIKENNLENEDICITRGSEKGDNYSGDMYRIQIHSKFNSSNMLLSAILKTNSSDDKRNEVIPLQTIYGRESTLYNQILPSFDRFQKINKIPEHEMFKYARCFRADEEVILLEDLSQFGFVMHNRFDPFDEDHLILVLTSLARYHSISFAMKENQPEIYNNLKKLVQKSVMGEFFKPMLEVVPSQTISIVKNESKREKVANFFSNIVERYFLYEGFDIAAPYNIICHGDCWNNNMLFKYVDGVPNEVIFVDWQISRYSSPITDIAQMLYCCTDKSVRNKLGSKIFDIYYETLQKQLLYYQCDIEKCYPREIFDEHLKKILPFGLIMSMLGLPIILTEKGKERDINEMMGSDISKNKIEFNNACTIRMNDIIDEFINMGLI